MRDYELVVLLPVGNEETVLSQVEKTLEQNKGKVGKTQKWGTKALSYPIAKQREASYFLLNVSIDPQGAVAAERTLRVNESIMRYLFVRHEKKDAGHKGRVAGGRVQGAVEETKQPEVKSKPEKEKKESKSAKSTKNVGGETKK